MHGVDETSRVIAASQALFGQGELAGVDERTLEAAKAEIPSADVSFSGKLDETGGRLPSVADLMAETGIVTSKSDGRRAITGLSGLRVGPGALVA